MKAKPEMTATHSSRDIAEMQIDGQWVKWRSGNPDAPTRVRSESFVVFRIANPRTGNVVIRQMPSGETAPEAEMRAELATRDAKTQRLMAAEREMGR